MANELIETDGHKAWADAERETTTIVKAEPSGDGWYSVTRDDGLSCGVPRQPGLEVRAGDLLTTWGRGFGSTIRGMAINGTVLHYRTEEEDRSHHEEMQRQRDAARRAEYETKRPQHDAIIAGLPLPFRLRLQGYRTRNPDFGWRFEAYELSCCVDAVKIAEKCQEVEGVTAFCALPWEQQKAWIPGLSDDHSGNSFGFACYLAKVYLGDPSLIPMIPGALAVLVGSDEYGDWSASEEARLLREAEGGGVH